MTEFAIDKLREVLIFPKSRSELIEELKIPERTLSYYISKLKRMGLIKEIPVLRDMRKKKFMWIKNKLVKP